MINRVITTETQRQKWQKVMNKLQTTWEANHGELECLHEKQAGIRSTQIGALVMMLIEMGIIK